MSKEVKKFEIDQSLQVKKYTSADGVVRYMKDGKLHNWEGPAVVHPDGNMEKPMEGKRFGQRLKWLNSQIQNIKEILTRLKKLVYETFKR